MFKGKIYSYTNINWKEKRFEKEFNNFEEYNDFLNSNPEFNTNNFLTGFDNYLENFFNSKFALNPTYENNLSKKLLPESVDINLEKYEKEAKKIDEEKEKNKQEKSLLEKTKEKLKWYLEKFKEEWKEDLVKNIKEDIKKIEEKLKKLI